MVGIEIESEYAKPQVPEYICITHEREMVCVSSFANEMCTVTGLR